MRVLLSLLLSLAVGPICCTTLAQEQTSRPTDEKTQSPIQDNSFLIEEAYNQEDGVVQHIS